MTDATHAMGEPAALASARAIAHAAVQPLSLAARANLDARPDDSHSNLRWHDGAFHAQPIGGIGVSLHLAPLALSLGPETLGLSGVTPEAALAWQDARLVEAGLRPAGAAALPYALPEDAAAVSVFADDPGLPALAAWYALAAEALEALAASLSDLSPGPSPVRCWPHHFDLATYIALEPGDPETARGIGAGLSPGDESFAEPYFYVNPWPHLSPGALPADIAPGRWHREGFVGSIATATDLLGTPDPAAAAAAFLSGSVAAGRDLLAAARP